MGSSVAAYQSKYLRLFFFCCNFYFLKKSFYQRENFRFKRFLFQVLAHILVPKSLVPEHKPINLLQNFYIYNKLRPKMTPRPIALINFV